MVVFYRFLIPLERYLLHSGAMLYFIVYLLMILLGFGIFSVAAAMSLCDCGHCHNKSIEQGQLDSDIINMDEIGAPSFHLRTYILSFVNRLLGTSTATL